MQHRPLAGLMFAIATCVTFVPPLIAEEPPTVPIGLDAYRQWDRWAQQRIGVRSYMRSTHSRAATNLSADASHYLYQLADDFNVSLDVEGPGILYFARYNHWHGSPWHYEVDGTDHIVQESSTADPNHPVANSKFISEDLFPHPLTCTFTETKGADLMWVPMMFVDRFRMAYSRTRYGTGYYIFHKIVPGISLTQPIKTWDAKPPAAQDVLKLLSNAGNELVPRLDTATAKEMDLSGKTGKVDVSAGKAATIITISEGPSALRAIEFSIPEDQAEACEGARLRITWDGREHASVDAPLPLFFGAGTLYNRAKREFLVKSLPSQIHFSDRRIAMRCYFPMPFFRSAKIEIVCSEKSGLTNLSWNVRWAPFADDPNHVGYFHATYKDHTNPRLGHDLVFLDTTNEEGAKDWSGQFIGTSNIFTHSGDLTTLEGDPRFFFDDSQSPQAYGTGTEEWGGGGDYWEGGQTMTLALAGHPVGHPSNERPHNDRDRIHSAYRFLLADMMPFGRNARIHFEHGGDNQSNEHYESVTYWYGIPSSSLVKTDTLQIGDRQSESSHAYDSPQATEPETITSRYELGPDTTKTPDGKDIAIFPAHDDFGTTTKGMSEFTIKLRPDNFGVMLRRKLDYQYPNQRAEVFIANTDEADPQGPVEWKPAGVWYVAGSNTCVYSDPQEELGPTRHTLITSNRRFRDDEFLLPRAMTEGRDSIRVRVKFTPVELPLFPGQPIADLAWSEIRYDAYCFVMPQFKP